MYNSIGLLDYWTVVMSAASYVGAEFPMILDSLSPISGIPRGIWASDLRCQYLS